MADFVTKGEEKPKSASVKSSSSTPTPLFTHPTYTFGEMLGEGADGKVYICTHKDTGVVFACKSIEKGLYRNQTVKREVAFLNKLKHPNIVTLKEFYEDNDYFLLFTDYCSGGTLSDQMTVTGQYTETTAADIIRQIVEALKICHQNGVIHHDIKPGNVMLVDKNGTTIKIIDFGLSLTFKPGVRFDSEYCGTTSYKAPELYRKVEYGPEIDIWSTGVVLYEMLYGTLPFTAPDHPRWYIQERNIGMAVCKGVKDFNWKHARPDISDGAIDLLKKMLDTTGTARITAQGILEHPWILNIGSNSNVSG